MLVEAGSWGTLGLGPIDHLDMWPFACLWVGWVSATVLSLFREENARKGKGKKGRNLSPRGGGKQSKTNLSHYRIT